MTGIHDLPIFGWAWEGDAADRYDGWDLDYAPENADDAYRSPDGPTPGGDCPAGGPHSPADDGPYCDNCHARLAPEDDPR